MKKSGLHLAVCSNKPRDFTRQLLDVLGLAPLIEAVIGPEDADRIKPAPDMFLAALNKLNVVPDDWQIVPARPFSNLFW